MFSLETFNTAYDTEIADLAVGGRPFRFHVPRTVEQFIDPENPLRDFPLWSKIWEASLLMATRVASRPVRKDERLIELGAGLGVTGEVAAAFGHDVTITEYDPHALAFIKANLLENRCTNARVRRLDWHHPDLKDRFDGILGSELIYKDSNFKTMRKLFRALLKPGGEILLAGEIRQTNKAFLDCMQSAFSIQLAQKTLRSETQVIPLLLIRMTPKS
ncbi:MAG: methyltransferase [Desulfosarcina sp.]|nr:methyltransferase [Desulfobacterales bacterium]